jgi:protein phosphatase PTC2/3
MDESQLPTDAQDTDRRSTLEKSHSFRKRRLTYTKHHLDAAAAAAAAQIEDPSGDEADKAIGDDDGDNGSDNSNEAKGKTFRERRLTFTKHQVAAAIAAIAEQFDDDDDDDVDDDDDDVDEDDEPPNKKARTDNHILHAGELMRAPITPAEALKRSKLYQGPFHFEPEPTKEQLSAQPEWKRRHTRRHSDNETNLPFSRHIVGIYSCHGVEPVYDSDYGDDAESSDEDDDWPFDKGVSPNLTSAKINQDRGGVCFPFMLEKTTALFAVYDGHGQGGELVSQFALHHIPRRLEEELRDRQDPTDAFKQVFLSVDRDLAKEPGIEPRYAGTTACVVLMQDNVLTISNAGDSRAVLAKINATGGYTSLDLSKDQNPNNPEEQRRIEAAGGFVSPPPGPGLSARVWLDASHSQIGLAMSRSIGDHAVKGVGVIAEPVVTRHLLEESDSFLILASDGVWEFMESQEAVDVVGKFIQESAARACQALIEAAANKWHQEEGDYRDDITALVIQIQKLWTSGTEENGGTQQAGGDDGGES